MYTSWWAFSFEKKKLSSRARDFGHITSSRDCIYGGFKEHCNGRWRGPSLFHLCLSFIPNTGTMGQDRFAESR